MARGSLTGPLHLLPDALSILRIPPSALILAIMLLVKAPDPDAAGLAAARDGRMR